MSAPGNIPQPPTLTDDRYLTTREACAFLQVSPKTLQRMRREGEVPYYRLGHRTIRYRPNDLRAAMHRCHAPRLRRVK